MKAIKWMLTLILAGAAPAAEAANISSDGASERAFTASLRFCWSPCFGQLATAAPTGAGHSRTPFEYEGCSLREGRGCSFAALERERGESRSALRRSVLAWFEARPEENPLPLLNALETYFDANRSIDRRLAESANAGPNRCKGSLMPCGSDSQEEAASIERRRAAIPSAGGWLEGAKLAGKYAKLAASKFKWLASPAIGNSLLFFATIFFIREKT